MISSNRIARLAVSCGVVFSIVFLLSPAERVAHGQIPPAQNNFKAAEALFKQGEDFKRKSMLGEACALYQTSMKVYARAATATKVAECQESEGRLVAALEEYRAALLLPDTAFHKRAEQEKDIHQRIAKLEPRVASVRIVIPAVKDLHVTHNGTELSTASLANPVLVDPGKHLLVAAAPDRISDVQTIELKEGEVREVTLSPKEPPPPPPPVVIPIKEPEPQKPVAPIPVPPPEDPGRGQRLAGAFVGGLGLVSLGVGAGFGIFAGTLVLRTHEMKAENEELEMQADRGRDVAIAALGAGVAAAVAGATIYATAPSSATPQQVVAVRTRVAPGYVTVEMTW